MVHTAATVLLLLGVNERTMMGVMGWSNPAMTHRYAHMVEPVRRDLATMLDKLLWDSSATTDGETAATPPRNRPAAKERS